ncbi:MAG: class C beta-lactamase-related serine hydrolase [Comamonadaceae bacterium]|nr:MAG: class C beta-lactamase-related serine hydrolase [Comamonadaceae bacterium]
MTSSAAPPARLADWRTAPHSRWAFGHVDALMPTMAIANDPNHVLPLPAAAQALDLRGLRVTVPGGEEPLGMEAFLRRTHTDALVVLSAGEVVHAWQDDGIDIASPRILMSASKSIVGLLFGVLAGRGLIDPQTPVTYHLPELEGSGYGGATLRHLLDMQADPAFDADDLRRYAQATGWEPAPEAAAVGEGLHRFFTGLPRREGRHGGAFRYLSANTDLMGWVIERVTGEPLARSLGELLWAPLGAAAAAAITLDRAGAPRATGGICATAHDLARLGQLLVAGGLGPNGPVVPAEWIADIGLSGDREAWRQGEFAAGFGTLPMHYRSGWYVIDGEPRTLFAMGIHGQHLFVDLEHRLVMAKLSSHPLALDPAVTGLTLRAWYALRRLLAR